VENLIEELTADGFEVVASVDDWEGDDDHYCVAFRKANGTDLFSLRTKGE